MYVRRYVCIYVCIYVCMYAYTCIHIIYGQIYLLPTGSEEREVSGVGSRPIPVAILPSCQRCENPE